MNHELNSQLSCSHWVVRIAITDPGLSHFLSLPTELSVTRAKDVPHPYLNNREQSNISFLSSERDDDTKSKQLQKGFCFSLIKTNTILQNLQFQQQLKFVSYIALPPAMQFHWQWKICSTNPSLSNYFNLCKRQTQSQATGIRQPLENPSTRGKALHFFGHLIKFWKSIQGREGRDLWIDLIKVNIQGDITQLSIKNFSQLPKAFEFSEESPVNSDESSFSSTFTGRNNLSEPSTKQPPVFSSRGTNLSTAKITTKYAYSYKP